MNQPSPENRPNPELHRENRAAFTEKFKELLSDIEFNETQALLEARMAAIEALAQRDQHADLFQLVWAEYTIVCEQIVDNEVANQTEPRARLQIAVLLHKALVFREVGDMKRYREELIDVEEYAHVVRLDQVAEAVRAELNDLRE